MVLRVKIFVSVKKTGPRKPSTCLLVSFGAHNPDVPDSIGFSDRAYKLLKSSPHIVILIAKLFDTHEEKNNHR